MGVRSVYDRRSRAGSVVVEVSGGVSTIGLFMFNMKTSYFGLHVGCAYGQWHVVHIFDCWISKGSIHEDIQSK